MISWSDFEKIDIRLGTILKVLPFPEAKRPAFQLLIDFGELGILRSSAQITHHYKAEELISKQIIAVVNFPKKQIARFMSDCLVLGVYDENDQVVLLHPDRPLQNGLKIG
ncbi:MAG: tRNA-binding protein [Sediminibacterium sp.]